MAPSTNDFPNSCALERYFFKASILESSSKGSVAKDKACSLL